LPSPNGATLSLDCHAPVVLAGCLRNASAVAAYAASQPGPITVIACGEQWPDGTLRPAVEDLLGAGALIRALAGSKSPEARAAEAAFDGLCSDLAGALAGCASGIELAQRGFAADVLLAAAHDSSTCVPRLVGRAYSAVGGHPPARGIDHLT
ncbi:MAG TPA: 2-phosphosulfolactate phosphatase, partial [Ideonella sp.]|nr:2-phosphosulfolactate phosphatase [Ideonella sp.]